MAEQVHSEPGKQGAAELRKNSFAGMLGGHAHVEEQTQDVDFNRMNAPKVQAFRKDVNEAVMARVDLVAASRLSEEALRRQIEQFVFDYANEKKSQVNLGIQREVAREIVNDMIGLGPLENIFHDDLVTDIMVNGPHQIYLEKYGKLSLSEVRFRDDGHLLQIAQRIANQVGRRVDSSNPLCDARLLDGSRVNIVLPPIALDGISISIRKFSKNKPRFDKMVENKSMGFELAEMLKVAGKIGLNVIVSGGTGSGKTTLLNALSSLIDEDERIVTCEDAAELSLQQPHVVRLESRPANIEGKGEITIRDLVRNALRMRPDRIIIGEVRGAECIDMLQAMNTGHDGSMATLHANSAREALTRLENMVAMSGFNLPNKVARQQIAGAVHIIVQTERMKDGVRRIKEVAEITGIENDEITWQYLFRFVFDSIGEDGKYIGQHVPQKVAPKFTNRAALYNLDKRVLELMGLPPDTPYPKET
jgi:pilus assembly protein CpaF